MQSERCVPSTSCVGSIYPFVSLPSCGTAPPTAYCIHGTLPVFISHNSVTLPSFCIFRMHSGFLSFPFSTKLNDCILHENNYWPWRVYITDVHFHSRSGGWSWCFSPRSSWWVVVFITPWNMTEGGFLFASFESGPCKCNWR